MPSYASVILIVGRQQSGKSTLLQALLTELATRGVAAAGILAHGLWRDGLRAGFDLQDVRTGATAPLARRLADPPPGRMPFAFAEEGLELGASALAPQNCGQADLVVVDEIGRLELAGKGWAPYLGPLLELAQVQHLWVVRTALVEAVYSRWHLDRPHIVDVADPQALAKLLHILSCEE